jgi:hypothetical protein
MVRLMILQLLFLSCPTSKNKPDFFETHKSKGVDVVVLNKLLNIPKKDNYYSIDTIYIRLENTSDFEYIFELNDSITIFSQGSFGYGEFTFDADPSAGTILRFFDSNNQILKREIVTGYTTEIPFSSNDKDMKYLKPRKTSKIKLITTFYY